MKSGDSMNFGFNTNVKVGQSVYHVQSEDRGAAHPFLDTVVYLAGRVVYKRSTSYKQFAKNAAPDSVAAKLHEFLVEQHRAVISELGARTLRLNTTEKREYAGEVPARETRAAGSVEERAGGAASPEVASGDGLDLRVLNPKGFFNAGEVKFEILLFDKRLKRPVGDAEIQAWLEKENERDLWAEARTDAGGRATARFLLPPSTAVGSSIRLRATDGVRFAQLRFRLRSKTGGKTPSGSLP